MKILFVFILVIPLIAFGQRSHVSLGVDIGFPNNNFQASAGTGGGGSFRYEYVLANRLTVIGTIGYISFAKKVYTFPSPPITSLSSKADVVPIQAGAKYYLFSTGNIRKGFYISGEMGMHVFSLRVVVNGLSQNSPSENHFSYAPGLGYRYGNLELSYRQQFISFSGPSINYTGFRIAYVFPSVNR